MHVGPYGPVLLLTDHALEDTLEVLSRTTSCLQQTTHCSEQQPIQSAAWLAAPVSTKPSPSSKRCCPTVGRPVSRVATGVALRFGSSARTAPPPSSRSHRSRTRVPGRL